MRVRCFGIIQAWIWLWVLWIWHRWCVSLSKLLTILDLHSTSVKWGQALLHHGAVVWINLIMTVKGIGCICILLHWECTDSTEEHRQQVVPKPEPARSLEDWPSHYRRDISLGDRAKTHVVVLYCWLPKEALFLQPELEQLIKRQCAQPQVPAVWLWFPSCHGDSQAWRLMLYVWLSVQLSQLSWA